MNGAAKFWLYWAACSAGGVLLSYMFAEYFYLPGVQQIASFVFGLIASRLISSVNYKSMVLGAIAGFVSSLIGILIFGSFNHPGDRSLLATFLFLNLVLFLAGAIVSMKVFDRSHRAQ